MTVCPLADPREHGRQAARSKRDRPGGHELSYVGAAGGGMLDPIEADSATQTNECAPSSWLLRRLAAVG